MRSLIERSRFVLLLLFGCIKQARRRNVVPGANALAPADGSECTVAVVEGRAGGPVRGRAAVRARIITNCIFFRD